MGQTKKSFQNDCNRGRFLRMFEYLFDVVGAGLKASDAQSRRRKTVELQTHVEQEMSDCVDDSRGEAAETQRYVRETGRPTAAVAMQRYLQGSWFRFAQTVSSNHTKLRDLL
jgi:hypothetical protein